jgi:UDP-glucose 4-epimerase
MRKKILIIGGSGFIGSSLCNRLKKNYEVTNYDINKKIISGVKYINGNINDKKSIKNAIKNNDIVFNLAGQTELEESQSDPYAVFNNNVLGIINILNACREYKVKRIVVASTVYVYSNLGGYYSISKKCAELITKEFTKRYKLKYSIIRFGSIYGPGARKGNAIYDILNMAVHKKKISYWGTGDERREYIHVDDATKSCEEILEKKYENKTIMCSGMQSTKISDMLIMLKEIFNNKIKIEYKKKSRTAWHYKITPYQIEEDSCYKLNLDNYIDFGKGLIDLINYLKKEKNNG